MQRGHNRSHIAHANLRVVAWLRQVTRGPAQHGGRARAHRYLVLSAFHAFQYFKGSVVAQADLVDSKKLVGDAEALADELQRDACAARRRFPSAENKKLRTVEAGNRLDG